MKAIHNHGQTLIVKKKGSSENFGGSQKFRPKLKIWQNVNNQKKRSLEKKSVVVGMSSQTF